MTSGYGGKIVLSIPAKLYTVVWILVGVILFSMMTSTFTAELLQFMSGHYDSISGSTVGVLKYREYDASLVVRKGGIIKESVEACTFHADLLELIGMLSRGEVDGILLDKYTMIYARGYLQWKKTNLDPHVGNHDQTQGEPYSKRQADIEYFLHNTEYSIQNYEGDRMSYGVLVKNSQDYEYLDGAVRDNRLFTETATESEINRLFPHKEEGEGVNPTHVLSNGYVFMWIGVIIAFIFAFGTIYEVHRKIRRQTKMKDIGDDTIPCLLNVEKVGQNPSDV